MPVKETFLSRSKSTRLAIVGTIGKIFQSEKRNLTRMMKHSDSCASISSVSSSLGFKIETPTSMQPPPAMQMKVGEYTICDIKDWLKPFEKGIEQHSFELYQSGLDHSKKSIFSTAKPKTEMIFIGRLHCHITFLKAQKEFGTDLLPNSISEWRHDLSVVNLHKKVWKEGYMYQLGGDCEV